MADQKPRVSKVIAALETTLKELAGFEAYQDIVLKPGRPATTAQIEKYEAYLGHPLPPTYRAFLELHNGYVGLAFPGDMLSIEDMMPGGEWHEYAKRWKKMCAKYGAGEVLDGIPFANLGQPNNWGFLDPTRIKKNGEMTVVDWEPEYSNDYPDLVAFLKECLETAQEGVVEEREGVRGE